MPVKIYIYITVWIETYQTSWPHHHVTPPAPAHGFYPELLRVHPVRATCEIDARILCVKILYKFTGQNPVTIVKLPHPSDVVTVIIVFIRTQAWLICWFSFATAMIWIDPNNISMLVTQNLIAKTVCQLLLTLALVSSRNVSSQSQVSLLSAVSGPCQSSEPWPAPLSDVILVIIIAEERHSTSVNTFAMQQQPRSGCVLFVSEEGPRYSGICHDASGINL